ncbi:MAG: hypothetical protein LBB43_01025 [Spirochaetaceae bacterium]|jgi:hypothetical protein|nr:hypothetical protein [Spirochaetaceae bacterium]
MKILLLYILLSVGVVSVSAVEDVQFYTTQFNNAKTVADQLLVVKTVAANYKEDPQALPFSIAALKRLVAEIPSLRSTREVDIAADIAWYITELIINLGSEEVAADPMVGYNLWQTIKTFSNPLVKANAIMAWGVIKDYRYFNEVVQLLDDLNTTRPLGKAAQLAADRIAFGAVIALESYGSPQGYLPVFFAGNGWYTGWVRKRAAEALPVILADPTEALLLVIQNKKYSLVQKNQALQAMDKSTLPDEIKSQAAVAALFEGWFTDPQTKVELIELRKHALDMLNRYAVPDDTAALYGTRNTVLWLLDRSYRHGADDREQRGAIAALGVIASDASIKQLGSYLDEIDDRLQRGNLTKTDERYARDIILAIGSSANSVVKTTLLYSSNLDWSASVHQLLNETLKQLQ